MENSLATDEQDSPSSLTPRADKFVPVTIDAERQVSDVDVYRSTYLIVTTNAPADVWEVDLPPLVGLHGLGALGMLGVVCGAIRATEETGRELTSFDVFSDPADIGAIFSLEQDGPLSIQVEDVWLPRAWCADVSDWEGGHGGEEVQRGDVFRVAIRLFQLAYRYSSGDIPIDELLEVDTTGDVYRSRRETAAFRYWADAQIEESREAFQRAPESLKLRWTDGG